MLQDRINRVNDRTPGYSRLPLIGRLFESDIDQPSSTAVVFMIKVRLVDPTGQPYNEREAPAER
jgi:type II secretory pathway component GspD/PulD (secretin)